MPLLYSLIENKLTTPNNTVSNGDVEINASISNVFRDSVRSSISMSRVPSQQPPNPLYVETIANQLPDALYGLVTNSRNIFVVPALPASTQVNYNEYGIRVAVKYTENGLVRTGDYEKPLRTQREIATAQFGNIVTAGIFYTHYDTISGQDGNEFSAATYSAPGDIYDFAIQCVPSSAGLPVEDSTLTVSVVTIGEQTVTVLASSVQPATAVGRAVTINGFTIAGTGGIGNLTAIEVWLDNVEQLFLLANQYYGGVIYESIRVDDSANLPYDIYHHR